ncbi:MAG: ABC transporter permease [Planctomycetota bacterium]|nr:MAG: ABC transporter permease [Planctomycetota bacterium]
MERWRREAALGVVLALLAGAVAIAAPEFYDAANLRNWLVDTLPLLVASVGMTFLMLAGQIDISVGAQFAVCGVLMGLLARAGLPPVLFIPVTLAAGGAIGALNGLLVARLRVPAIIATLAGMAVLRGTLRWLSGGAWVADLPPSFPWFGLSQDAGQAVFMAAAALLFLLALLFLRWTSWGRAVLATGGDAEAARLAGIRPEGVVFGVFVAMGAFVAAAALLSFPRYPAVEIEAGIGFELKVIACVIVGGVSIQGGRGSLVGTLLGVALLSVIGTMLVFLRVDAAWERAIQGGIILAAVTLDSLLWARRSGARA